MDLSQYLLALKARRKAFTLVLGATVIAALVVALLLPKRYDASATVLLDMRDEQTMSPTRLSPRSMAGYIFTQMDLIASGKVAQKVARDLKLAQNPGVREDWERETGGKGSIEEWIGANLLEKLKVDTGASNIIIIKYSSSDPKKAADVANGFAKAYLDVALQMRTEPNREAAEWFDQQIKALRSDVTTAQGRLTAYQKDKGIYADERVDIEQARMTEISTQLNAQRNATYDAQTRYQQAQDLLAAGASADSFPEILSNGYITTIKAALQAAEARLEEQSQTLGANHPTLQRTKLEVEGLKERMAAETKKVITSLGNAAQQSKKREAELAAALAAQQERIVKLRDARVEMAVLTRDLDNAQRAYDGAQARYVANRIESKARQTNLALLTPAAEPSRAAFPKVGMITMLSVIVGLLLAAGVVYLLELLDRRVRSRSDLESRLAVPSLGVLSQWTPAGARLLPSPARAARALPHPW
jgi:chain length determinant protein EpsF